MAFSHRGGDRTTQYLLPPSLDEWVPQDHLARFVVATVDQLDLGEFARPWRSDGKGRRAYHPAMLVALVLLAWCEGVRSSRKIEGRCIEHIGYRWLTGNEIPDHSTISRFVKDKAQAIDRLFAQVLRLAVGHGMARVGTVVVDGTKVGADASSQASMTRQHIEDEARRIREEHEANDAADDERFGPARGDELPPDLADPRTRDARILEALRQLEAEDRAAEAAYQAKQAEHAGKGGRPPKAPTPTVRKANVTDPDCRVMKGPHRYGPAYNAQAAVSEDQLIVATDVTQDRTDNDQFTPMADAAQGELADAGAGSPDWFVADAGYWNPQVFDKENDGPQVLIPPVPNPRRQKLAQRGPIPAHATLTQRRERTMATKAAKARYAKRASTVEPVFGQIKGARGITRFRRRGLEAARSEWRLIGTTHNILKMWRAGISLS